MATDKVTEYLIALYLAAGGEVNKAREWLKEAKQNAMDAELLEALEREINQEKPDA